MIFPFQEMSLSTEPFKWIHSISNREFRPDMSHPTHLYVYQILFNRSSNLGVDFRVTSGATYKNEHKRALRTTMSSAQLEWDNTVCCPILTVLNTVK